MTINPSTGVRGFEPGRQDEASANSILFSGAPTSLSHRSLFLVNLAALLHPGVNLWALAADSIEACVSSNLKPSMRGIAGRLKHSVRPILLDESNKMASELIGGLFFLIMGAISIILNKPGARLFSEYQKHFGWQRGTTFGRALHIVGGTIGLLLGFMMLFVARS